MKRAKEEDLPANPQPCLSPSAMDFLGLSLSGATVHPHGAYSSGERGNGPFGFLHMQLSHQKLLLLIYFVFFWYILQYNSNFLSYIKFTSNFWFSMTWWLKWLKLWTLVNAGSSLHNLPLSSLSPPIIHLPSLDRENGAFFSSNFLWVVGLILPSGKLSDVVLPSLLPISFIFLLIFLLLSRPNLQFSIEFLILASDYTYSSTTIVLEASRMIILVIPCSH